MASSRFAARTFVTPALFALLLASPVRADSNGQGNSQNVPPAYAMHVLVSDGSVPADHIDTHLVNPWGIVFNPTGPVWIANNGTGTSTLYDGNGNAIALVVTIPATNGDDHGNPTGIVFSGGNDFAVSAAGKSGP